MYSRLARVRRNQNQQVRNLAVDEGFVGFVGDLELLGGKSTEVVAEVAGCQSGQHEGVHGL